MLNQLQGLRIVVNPSLDRFEQIQSVFPRSKKKRIRKKFSRNRSNYTAHLIEEMFRVGDTLMMGPLNRTRLEDALKRKGRIS